MTGAVKDGDAKTVKVLLAKGADANAENNDGETVLMLAAESAGYTKIVHILKQAGAFPTNDSMKKVLYLEIQ